MIWNAFTQFLTTAIQQFLNDIANLLIYISDTVFFFEKSMVVGTQWQSAFVNLTNNIGATLSYIGAMLITIKFLTKGLNTYIADTDGGSEEPINSIFMRYIYAMVLCLGFPAAYNAIVSVISNILDNILTSISNSMKIPTQSLASFMMNSVQGGKNLFWWIIIAIMLGILLFQFVLKGAELWVFRLATPIFAMGLIDADRGIFSSWYKKVLQNCFTILVQLCCYQIAVWTMFNGQLILTIIFLFLALKTPRLLQEFMLTSGGNKMYMVSQGAYALRSLLKSAK